MKELIVISGKGGTGKTSITGALAHLARSKVLCDADVDAADLHLLTAPQVRERHDFQSGRTAVIHRDGCTACGTCRDLCRWNAIDENYIVDPVACEGCGVCVHFCPEKTIQFPLNTCGEWYISDTRFGPMVHARLGIAQENSGKLVTLVRQQARNLAQQEGFPLLLTDGPPGTGCPVIAAIGGADGVLAVTEPSRSGIHDLKRVCELARHFRVPAMICINKFDLNPERSREIEAYAQAEEIECLGRIPFDPAFTHAMVRAETIFESEAAAPAGVPVRKMWKRIAQRLDLDGAAAGDA